MQGNTHLKEVGLVFLKLGFIAFGGPAAHIAMMEEEIVNKRKWISREHFLDLVGATNLIPGPNSTEMTMHCGYERAGMPGLFLAGICFIFPAAIITGIFAWLYVLYGKLPAVEPFLYGIKPAIIAIILNAVYRLGQNALKNWQLGLIGAAVIAVSFLGVNEIYVLLGAGIVAIIWFSGKDVFQSKKLTAFSPLVILSVPGSVNYSTGKLFMIFLKIGATLFGSGYVLVAYLQAELIDKNGWLTQTQLLDAVAIGQFTPGPLFSTATFIGYQVGGITGAVFATIGIFLPSFFFVLFLNPYVSKLRASKIMGFFLDGVNIGAIGVMLVVTIQLSNNVLTDWRSWLIALLSLMLVIGLKKLNATWIVLGSAVMGYLLRLI
jgi:chromate transporter